MSQHRGGLPSPDDPGGRAPGPGHSTGQMPSLPAGQMFMAGTDLILADEYRADAVAGFSFDEGSDAAEQLHVQCTFAGRRNHATERASFTVAMSPMDALLLIDQLIKAFGSIERRAAARRTA